MYVDKIDELIDKILNMFYSDVWQKNTIKLKDNKKFKDQGDSINKMVLDFIKNIKQSELEIIGKSHIDFLKETLIRYLYYYIFMAIYVIVNDEEIYIKELIEISKNIAQSKLTIKNFYNSQNNSYLIKLNNLLSGILVMIEIDDPDKIVRIVKSNPNKYDPVVTFLNDVGNEYIQKLFNKKNPNYLHNIIKTIIFKQIYVEQEKKDFLLFVEDNENSKVEYKYITIVVPKTDYVDFASIENILIKNFDSEIIEDVYNMMMEYDEYISTPVRTEYKINQLFEKKIIVPIVEDFLRYHKHTESDIKSVDKIDSNERSSRQDNTKMKYIVSKMNDIIDYNSIKDEKRKKEIEKYFYGNLKDRRVVLINELEEERIIEKLLLQGSNVLENNTDYEDLREIRQYAYINFRDMATDGFTFKPEKTTDAIRDINIVNMKHNKGIHYLQMRIGNKNQALNIVGLAIPNNKSKFCGLTNNLKEISGNGYEETLKILETNLKNMNNMYGRNKSENIYYWLFDMNKDKIEYDTYKNIDNIHINEYYKNVMEKLYDDLLNFEMEKIYNFISKQKNITLHMIKLILKKYNDNLLVLPENIKTFDLYKNLVKLIVEGDYSYDLAENIIPGLNKELIKLPIIIEKKEEESIVRIKKIEQKEEETIEEYSDAVCLHNYEWELMSIHKYKNPNKFNQMFFEFFKKYSMFTIDKQFICKSCSAILDIQKYVTEYQGGSTEEITISLAAERELENLPEYEKFTRAIKNIDKLISKIGGITNLYYYVGSEPIIKLRRQNIVKQVIDTIMTMSPVLKEKNKLRARGEHSGKTYGISKDLSYVFGFDLDNEIFVYSSQEVDKFKLMKYNNILVYIIFTIIFELNNIDILNMIDQKICNFILFEKYGINLFDKILIRNSNKDDLTYIQDYKLLCYVIFFISCSMSRYNIWFNLSKETTDIDKKTAINPIVQKMIIHTLVDIINIILEVNTQKEKSYIIEVISTKFLIKLRTLFNDNKLYDKLKTIATKNIYIDNQTNKVKVLEKEIKNITLTKDIKYSSDVNRPSNLMVGKTVFVKREYGSLMQILSITSLSNCDSSSSIGRFHEWDYKKDLSCKNCKKKMEDILKEKHNNLKDEYFKNRIKTLAIKFCPDGKTHRFDPYTNKCLLCNKEYAIDMGEKYSEGELNNMIKSLSIKRIKNNKEVYEELIFKKNKINKIDNLLIKLKNKY